LDISELDHKADTAIKTMMATIGGFVLIPAHVNWALISGAMGTGVVAIGMIYGVKLNKDEAWKLVKQFVLAAGFMFAALNIGSKFFSVIAESTGIGYAGGVALDAAINIPFAYAVGHTAKEYFRKEYMSGKKLSQKELGEIFRNAFKERKSEGK
jgi:uncharacterized protein (DUF697 family)